MCKEEYVANVRFAEQTKQLKAFRKFSFLPGGDV